MRLSRALLPGVAVLCFLPAFPLYVGLSVTAVWRRRVFLCVLLLLCLFPSSFAVVSDEWQTVLATMPLPQMEQVVKLMEDVGITEDVVQEILQTGDEASFRDLLTAAKISLATAPPLALALRLLFQRRKTGNSGKPEPKPDEEIGTSAFFQSLWQDGAKKALAGKGSTQLTVTTANGEGEVTLTSDSKYYSAHLKDEVTWSFLIQTNTDACIKKGRPLDGVRIQAWYIQAKNSILGANGWDSLKLYYKRCLEVNDCKIPEVIDLSIQQEVVFRNWTGGFAKPPPLPSDTASNSSESTTVSEVKEIKQTISRLEKMMQSQSDRQTSESQAIKAAVNQCKTKLWGNAPPVPKTKKGGDSNPKDEEDG